MEDKERLKLLLKKAKLLSNLGFGVLTFAMLLLVKQGVFPNAFTSQESSSTEIVQTEEITAYDPNFGLDPSEIENGIHIPTGLKVDEGVGMVRATCSVCHSIDLVTQNRGDKKAWKDMIVWMQETQGLWDLGENEDLIIKYLAKNYAPEDTGRRRNLKNIEWYEL
ncbi:MAG: monoheme cytochrome C [Putridiphycobacter sp.]|nr:monoheme cytochrome C [Putridiphycobacter sp.]